MKMQVKTFSRKQIIDDPLSEGLTILRPSDVISLFAALIAFLVACVYVVYECSHGGDIYALFPLLTVPLFVCGGLYILRRKWWIFVIIAAILLVIFLLNISDLIFYIAAYITLGAVGCVAFSNSIQRWMLFKVITAFESINVKRDLSVLDRIIAFVFNIPGGLDTRDLKLNRTARRSGIPWKDMLRCVLFCLGIGMVLGIYLSTNPEFISRSLDGTAVVYLFSLVSILPLASIPWFVFKSLDVRVGQDNRVFRLYDGLISTLYRMAVPVFLFFVVTIVFINSARFTDLLECLMLSAVMIVVITLFVSAIYYMIFETRTVMDVNTKWTAFRPVQLFANVNEKERSSVGDLPGTPTRDRTDIGVISPKK